MIQCHPIDSYYANVSKPLVRFKESIVNVSKQELIYRKAYINKQNGNNNNYIEAMFGNRYDHIEMIKKAILNDNKCIQFSVEAIALKYKLIELLMIKKI